MKCPRRSESQLPSEMGEDSFAMDDCCNYCGSLNPATFMARLEAGDVTLTPTDKNYKVYIRNVNGAKFKMQHSHAGSVQECPDPSKCSHWKVDELDETKFYFMHLSPEQKQRFIELYNEKKMRLGEPGYFYVRPFFCVELSLRGREK